MAAIFLATREDVRNAIDVAESPRDNAAVDKALAAVTGSIYGRMKRTFVPVLATRRFDWPNRLNGGSSYRLWLNDNEMLSVSRVVSGGVELDPTTYFLRRMDSREDLAYTHLEIDLGTNSAFVAGNTPQKSIAITGVFCGAPFDEEQVAALSAVLAASASATVSVTWSSMDYGVGSVLRIDDERMIVTGRSMLTTGQALGADADASFASNLLSVSDGTAFAIDETLLIGSERMQVVDIAGNSLIVKRAAEATVLAAHLTGATIYGLTGITVARAQLGTTLAAHSSAAPVLRGRPPGLIGELAVAEAENTLMQRRSGYARTTGEGENQRESSGRGLAQIRADADALYRRKLRLRSI